MDFDDPVQMQREPELLIARRAFPVTQERFAGEVTRHVADEVTVGWYGSNTFPEIGAVALVRSDGDYRDLRGEIVRVAPANDLLAREVFVYVAGSSGLVEEEVDLSLSRRAFLAVKATWRETFVGEIGVVG